MSLAKIKDFNRNEIEVSIFAKALAHPARIAILNTLAQRKECVCGELVIDLPLAQSTVSQHLKALKEIGLIKGTIDGPRSRYCIDWIVFDRFHRRMGTWSKKILEFKMENCC